MTIAEFFERPDVLAGCDPGAAVVDYTQFAGATASYETIRSVGGTEMLPAFECRLAAVNLALREVHGKGYLVERAQCTPEEGAAVLALGEAILSVEEWWKLPTADQKSTDVMESYIEDFIPGIETPQQAREFALHWAAAQVGGKTLIRDLLPRWLGQRIGRAMAHDVLKQG